MYNIQNDSKEHHKDAKEQKQRIEQLEAQNKVYHEMNKVHYDQLEGKTGMSISDFKKKAGSVS